MGEEREVVQVMFFEENTIKWINNKVGNSIYSTHSFVRSDCCGVRERERE